MPNDPSIKCQGLYESLKKQGYSKAEAARISNGLWRKGKCTGKRKNTMTNAMVATKEHTGIMVALFLPLVVAQGIAALYRDQFDLSATVTPANELHLTLLYLGDTSETEYDAGQLFEWISEWAREQQPINGKLNGVGKFNSVSPEGVPVYLSYDSPELPAFRQSLVDFFQSKGLKLEFNHGFTPHITLAYTPNYKDGWLIDVPQQEIAFGEVVLAYGDAHFVASLGNQSGFFVTKDAQGNYRWVLISSSAYVDRDGEIVTEKALVRAVERMDETGDYGQLRWWHTGVVLGDADFAAVHAHQLIESGTFVSKSVAAAVAVAAQGLGASIGFKHPPTQPRNKQYEDIAIQERSILPRGKESNLFTQLSVTGGRMDDTKKAALFDLLGEEEATALLSRADVTAKAADEAGFTRKEATPKSWWQSVKDAFSAIPDPEELEAEGDELELTDSEAEPAAVTDETKAAKEDDMDEAPVTRAEFMKLAARIDEMLGERKKETDTLATKEEVAQVAAVVAPVVTVQQETVKRLGEVEKQVQTLTSHELPRGVAGVFRASQAAGTATDKAAALGEKMKQSNDPLDGWVAEKFGA